jgi:hypothetical protein
MSVRYEEYKGEKILYIDFSNLKDQEYLDAIDEAEKEILKNKPGTISTIINVANTYITEELKIRFSKLAERTKGITKVRATVGLTGIKRIIAKAIKRDLYFASSDEDAKEWIVRNT